MNMDEEASNLSTFDIYSDLLLEQQTPDQGSGVHVSVDQLEKANVENEAKVKQLSEQLQSVLCQCKALEAENVILKRNISELFKTAQAELRRKDGQMEELEKRRPRFRWGQQDYNASINDRLRDLRNESRGHYNRSTSSSHHETVVDSRRPGDEQAPDSTKKSAKTEQTKPPGQSERPNRTSGETLPVGSDQNVNDERIVKSSDNHLEEGLLMKADGVRKYSDGSRSRAGESHRRQREKNQPARSPRRETSHRSPNRSKDHKERTQHETSPRHRSSEHKEWTVHSSSKHSKDSVKDDQKQSHSLYRSRSRERSRSRGRSRGSDKSSKHETSDGSRSRRKRKHSSGRKQNPKSSRRSSHTAPHKKLRRHDKEKSQEASDGRRSQCNPAAGNKVDQETPVPADVIARRSRHPSSRVVSSMSMTGLAWDDEHSRKRHKSDRKNKSLKRAKDTLHRKHSTPQKHRREEGSKRHRSALKALRSKGGIKELIGAGHEDMDNQEVSDTGWVPEESVHNDDPGCSNSPAAIVIEEGELQDDCGVPEEDSATRTACSAAEMPQNHHMEMNKELASDSLYGSEEAESTDREDRINSAENEGKVNDATVSQSGTNDQEVVDGQCKTEIRQGEKDVPACHTKSSGIFDTCHMQISGNQHSLPACNLETWVQGNESLETLEISSVMSPLSESCDPTSSEVVGVLASQVHDRGVSSNFSPSIPSSATESKTVLNKESTYVKEDTVSTPKSAKDPNYIRSSDEAECTDVALNERIGKIDESEGDNNSGNVPIGVDHSDLKQNAVSSDSCSRSKVSTRPKIDDSFSEKILDVFGSNSFLWSDDVDSSMEMTVPPTSDTLPLAKTLQDNPPGDGHSVAKPLKKLERFSETLMNIFGSDSFTEGDDVQETSNGAQLNLADVASDDQSNRETPQGSKASPKGLPGSTEKDCSVDHETESGNILDTILGTYDNGSLTGFDVKFSGRASPSSVLITEEPIIQSEDAMFETLQSSAHQSDIKAKKDESDPTSSATCNVNFTRRGILCGQEESPLGHSLNTDMIKSADEHLRSSKERPKARVEKEYVDKLKLENQATKQEGVLSKISPMTLLDEEINESPGHSKPAGCADVDKIPGVNSASPRTSHVITPDNVETKSALRTDFIDTITSLTDNEDGEVVDSENRASHLDGANEADISIDHSGYDLLSCSASPVHGDFLTDSDSSSHTDQEYHADQVSDDQQSDQHVDDKQSEICDLSEGEIASSDSETSTDVIAKTEEAPQTADRKSNRTRSKPSPKRSRREDKHSSSHKARGHSRDRHRKTVTGHDRFKFLEEKRKILEERQQALENPVRRHPESKGGIKAVKGREHGSHSSMRRRLPSRESPEKRRFKNSAVETRGRQEDCRDERRRNVHVDDSARSRDRHGNCHQNSRRHDRDHCHDRPGNKTDRRSTQSAEELKRTRNSRTHRR